MSRSRALQEETNCIYSYPITKLYQTRPGDRFRPSDLSEEERGEAIEEYESHFDASRLVQIPNPRVEYTPEVRSALTCEDCGAHVTDGVINYSHENFDGHVFCMRCQPRYQTNPQTRTTNPLESVCEGCGSAVTRGVINFSLRNFGNHIFCMDCQSYH
jgi:hypothetical protein